MNIANLSKYCPKGTKLYCTLYGNAELGEITNIGTIVIRKEYSKYIHQLGLIMMDGGMVTNRSQRDVTELSVMYNQCMLIK